jgi:hypothetical protein
MTVPNITIATSVRYGSYKRYFDEALWIVEKLVYSFDDVLKHYVLPERLLYHIRPIRSEHGRAYWYTMPESASTRYYCVEIDVRQEEEEFYDTVLHELTHIEQFASGRLKCCKDQNYFNWLGKKMITTGITIAEYNELPWEKEAIEKAKKLRKVIFD